MSTPTLLSPALGKSPLLYAWVSFSSVKWGTLVRVKGHKAHQAFRTGLAPSLQSVDVCFYDCGPGPMGNKMKIPACPRPLATPSILLSTENNEGNK